MATENTQENNQSVSSVKLGLYQHYKGGQYEVIGVGLDSGSKAEMVVYVQPASGQMWIREKDEFLSEVTVDDQTKPRFTFISESESASADEKYKRALADYHNLVKQQAKEKTEFVRYALAGFLEDLIPVYDHLKLSLQGVSPEEMSSAWAQGVSHVLKQFKELLSARGVEEVKTVGEKFDHDLMEAISGQGEIVKQEVMPGYTLNGKLIRPAKVIVGDDKQEDNL